MTICKVLIRAGLTLALGLLPAVLPRGFGTRPARAAATATDDGEPMRLPQVIELARQAAEHLETDLHDYSAVMVKRERVSGQLADPKAMYIKFREKPFSVYLYLLDPEQAGDEAIYVDGRNDGNLLGHTTGWTGKLVGTVSLNPSGLIAMQGQLHPITNIGIRNLCLKLIEFGRRQSDPDAVEIRRFHRASVNGRPCSLLRIVYPVEEPGVRAYLIRVFLDDAVGVPIRLEVYQMTDRPGETPQLQYEYTYAGLKVNRGFTDADFDPKNPAYHFP